MKVFVIGTGRCGSVTFSKACEHIEGYTAGHESHNGHVGNYRYDDNHIEVDPRLSYSLPMLIKQNPDALFVHLYRNAGECIASLAKRDSLKKYAAFHFGASTINISHVASIYYNNTVGMIRHMLKDIIVNSMEINLATVQDQWPAFLERINAEPDDKQYEMLSQKFNQAKL